MNQLFNKVQRTSLNTQELADAVYFIKDAVMTLSELISELKLLTADNANLEAKTLLAIYCEGETEVYEVELIELDDIDYWDSLVILTN